MRNFFFEYPMGWDGMRNFFLNIPWDGMGSTVNPMGRFFRPIPSHSEPWCEPSNFVVSDLNNCPSKSNYNINVDAHCSFSHMLMDKKQNEQKREKLMSQNWLID